MRNSVEGHGRDLHIWAYLSFYTHIPIYMCFWRPRLQSSTLFDTERWAWIRLNPLNYLDTTWIKTREVVNIKSPGTEAWVERQEKKTKNLKQKQFPCRVGMESSVRTSWLLCVLRTGLLMSLHAYCMCESQHVGTLQDQFPVCKCGLVCSCPTHTCMCVCVWCALGFVSKFLFLPPCSRGSLPLAFVSGQ